MRDGKTHNLAKGDQASPRNDFLARHRASLVVVQGSSPRRKIELERSRTVFGRGSEAHVSLADEAMSQQHFALEIGTHGVRLLDLGSTNGVKLNGKVVEAAELAHADRIGAGNHVLQFVVEEFDREPPGEFVFEV